MKHERLRELFGYCTDVAKLVATFERSRDGSPMPLGLGAAAKLNALIGDCTIVIDGLEGLEEIARETIEARKDRNRARAERDAEKKRREELVEGYAALERERDAIKSDLHFATGRIRLIRDTLGTTREFVVEPARAELARERVHVAIDELDERRRTREQSSPSVQAPESDGNTNPSPTVAADTVRLCAACVGGHAFFVGAIGKELTSAPAHFSYSQCCAHCGATDPVLFELRSACSGCAGVRGASTKAASKSDGNTSRARVTERKAGKNAPPAPSASEEAQEPEFVFVHECAVDSAGAPSSGTTSPREDSDGKSSRVSEDGFFYAPLLAELGATKPEDFARASAFLRRSCGQNGHDCVELARAFARARIDARDADGNSKDPDGGAPVPPGDDDERASKPKPDAPSEVQ